MSSFFTLPASQKKRKRPQPSDTGAAKRSTAPRRKEARDDSISGSEASGDDAPPAQDYSGSESEDEELRDEDPASKRIRLAEQYLANTQREVLEQDGGFDAAEIDQENLRRRMGDRLKEDTAESKGKLYRWVAEDLDWSRAESNTFKADTKAVTGVAVAGQYVYTVTKDFGLAKWELPSTEQQLNGRGHPLSRKPKKVGFTRGSKHASEHHQSAILCVAASSDGRFVVTGGADNRLIVWDAPTLKPLKIFTGQHRDNGHRDNVTALAFRRGTNQLYSASKDRTVKIWSLDELAYVETLFGHQDEVVDVSALAKETCVSVGARDRSSRFWKVVEESQLVFRGGGAGASKSKRERHDSGNEQAPKDKQYHEGSIDRVACIDDDTFITGSDNGSLSLWNVHKKKPVFTLPLAHGLDPPLPLEEASAEVEPDESLLGEPQPRWITALEVIPFSDVVFTGSWDGYVRAWRISQEKRRIEPLGPLGSVEDSLKAAYGEEQEGKIQGMINDLAIVERGDRGKDGVLVVAAVGREHRLGRWRELKDGKNCGVLFEVSRKVLRAESGANAVAEDRDINVAEAESREDGNEGFD